MEAATDIASDDVNYQRLYEQELTQDLWIEIFIRASVESLLRVKCVCTRWHALVGNSSFTKKHLQFQKKKRSVYGLRFLLEGPINGLYCVYGGTDRIVIWNPATEEVSFLPLAGECFPGKVLSYECRDGIDDYRYILAGKLGFGTDPLNEDDYKVVMICEQEDESGVKEFSHLLYTNSTNTWRIIKVDNFVGFDYTALYYSKNIFLDGFYYLFDVDGDLVIAFDMGKEIFQKISIPNSHSRRHSDLVVHNDVVTLLDVNEERKQVDVWELIPEESIWIKKNSVVVEVRGIIQASLGYLKKDDEMLFVIGDSDSYMSGDGQTVLYNTTTREITNVGPRGWGHYFKALVYYESLVSLSGNITKYRGNRASCLDAIYNFLCGDTMQEAVQQLEEL